MKCNQEDLQPERKHTAQRINTVLDKTKKYFLYRNIDSLVFEHSIGEHF